MTRVMQPPMALRRVAAEAALRLDRADLPLAVTLLETHHRPGLRRVAEYLYWWALRAIGSKRHHRVTLGRSQVRASLILDHLAERGIRPTIFNVMSEGESLVSAVLLASRVLSTIPPEDRASATYTGRSNPYYDGTLQGLIQVMERARCQRLVVWRAATHGSFGRWRKRAV